MSKRIVVAFAAVVLFAAMGVYPVSAGGPVCPPMGCGPAVCPPPLCPPPACPPPLCCPPPRCAPPMCKENPLAMIVKGACQLVVGVVALPFKAVDCLIDGLCRPKCGPMRVACGPPRMACAPPICVPPVVFGPGYGPPPGFGYGMGRGRPMGFGQGAPRRFAPMAGKEKALPLTMIAVPNDGGVFGAYW
jgi:hypothetical protein